MLDGAGDGRARVRRNKTLAICGLTYWWLRRRYA
jgi:hypothetical protein